MTSLKRYTVSHYWEVYNTKRYWDSFILRNREILNGNLDRLIQNLSAVASTFVVIWQTITLYQSSSNYSTRKRFLI